MLTLTLLRHAKSSWNEPELSDIERGLNARGQEAAQQMGAYMTEQNIVPDLILCSSAKRTRQTLQLLLQSAQFKTEVRFLDELYLSSVPDHYAIIQKMENKYQHLCIIGHNPTFQSLALDLTGSANLQDLHAMTQKYPTAGLSVFRFETSDWKDIRKNSGFLTLFTTPSHLLGQLETSD